VPEIPAKEDVMLENFFPAVRKQREAKPRRDESVFGLMQEMLDTPQSSPGMMSPAVDVSEDDQQVRVKAEIPGIDPEEIGLTIEGNTLIIQGERRREEEKKGENSIRREVFYGSFRRAILLPADVDRDRVKATYSKGILEVVLPKTEGAKPRRIQVG
jgi:HSP20 family protein